MSFSWLIKRSFSNGKPSLEPTTPPNTHPVWPVELIYEIVDTHYAPETSDDTHVVGSLAGTCRSLANYCRPLLFHSIILKSGSLTRTSQPFRATGRARYDPNQFRTIVRKSPDILHFVRDLSIHIGKPFQRTQYAVLRKAGLRKSEDDDWLYIFQAHYANLRKLRFSFDWLMLSKRVQLGLLMFLSQASKLEVLELDIRSMPMFLLKFLPTGLGRLVVARGWGWDHEWSDPPSPAIEPPTNHIPARIEALTTTSTIGEGIISRLLPENDPPMDLTSLKHLQLGSVYNGASQHSIHNQLILLSFASLQCVHVGASALMLPSWPLNIADLPVLRYWEIRTSIRVLRGCLGWVSVSLGIAPTEAQDVILDRLKFSIIVHQSLGEDLQSEWDKVSKEDPWPNLKVARILGYADPEGRQGKTTPTSMGPYGAPAWVDESDYASFSKVCSCGGWRYQWSA